MICGIVSRCGRKFGWLNCPHDYPVTGQTAASGANSGQVARIGKSLKRLDWLGKSEVFEKRISVWQTALRGSLEVFDLPHPAGQWVPSGENLGHHPFISILYRPQV